MIVAALDQVARFGIAGTTFARTTALVRRVILLFRQEPRRFQNAMLRRRQPQGNEQERNNFSDEQHDALRKR